MDDLLCVLWRGLSFSTTAMKRAKHCGLPSPWPLAPSCPSLLPCPPTNHSCLPALPAEALRSSRAIALRTFNDSLRAKGDKLLRHPPPPPRDLAPPPQVGI